MAVADLGTLIANETALSPENLTKLIVKLTQGTLIMEQVLPVQNSTDAFIWHTEKDTTEYNLPREVGEKAEAEDNAIEYEKHTASVKDFFQKMEFSEKELRNGNVYDFINPVQRAAMTISRKLKLAVEYDAVAELTNTTKYSGINTQAAGTKWNTHASSTPIDDIEEAKFLINNALQIDSDVIILSSRDYKNLMLSDQIRSANQYTRSVVDGLEIEQISGLRIIKSDAVYNVDGTLTRILDGTGIILPSAMVGSIYESKSLAADREYSKTNRTLTIFGERSFKTIITQPKGICLVTGLYA